MVRYDIQNIISLKEYCKHVE